MRARRLEKYLGTPTRIYFKYGGITSTSSYKVNKALAQAYYNAMEGIKRIVTETEQQSSALSLAEAFLSLKVRVHMVRVSYSRNPTGGP